MIDPTPYLTCRYRFKPRNQNEHNCWTLVRQVIKDSGRELKEFPFCPDQRDAIKNTFESEMKTGMGGMLNPIATGSALMPLDVIVTKRKIRWLLAFHAGVMIDNEHILHITNESKSPIIDKIETVEGFTAWR